MSKRYKRSRENSMQITIIYILNLIIIPALLTYYWITLDIGIVPMALFSLWGINFWVSTLNKLTEE